MAIVGTYDGSGYFTGFYDTDYNTAIPTPYFTLTSAQRAELLANPVAYRVSGGNLVVPPQPSAPSSSAVAWAAVREKRNLLLAQTDFIQLADCPISSSSKSSFVTYRQTLRDIPQTYSSDPATVVWPTVPSYAKA